MSEFRVNTLSDAAGTGPVTLTKQSAAKTFCNWDNNGTISVTKGFNVSSVTDISVGRTNVDFTNNFDAADWCAAFSFTTLSAPSNTNSCYLHCETINTSFIGDARLIYSSAFKDDDFNQAVVHGDLA